MVISESEGREIVGPFQGYFAESQQQGWDNFLKEYRHVLYRLLPQNRSDLVNREINLAANTIFTAMPGIHVQPTSHGQYWIVIHERVAVRFKKLDKFLLPSWNHGTQQSRNINHQDLSLGLADYAWLNAGYIPNKLWSAIESMYLVHPRNDTTYWWRISLLDEPQIGIDFTPLPDPPTPTLPPTQPPRRRPRWQFKEGEAIPKEQTHGSTH
jgi:hypothetical protein